MRWQLMVLCSIILIISLASILSPADPMRTEPDLQMQPPNLNHLLGTDLLGRDVLSRLLYGGQRTLIATILAASIAIVAGSGIGILAGLSVNKVDAILSSLINALLAIPNLLLALVILTLLGGGIVPLIFATGFTQIAPVARVLRVAVIAVRMQPYIESGYAIGLKRWHIVYYYILPNIQNTLLAYGPVTFSYCLLNSSALNYLGLGGEPGVPDWGVMLAEGRNTLHDAPWVALASGFAITIMIWLINSLIDQQMAKTKSHY